MIDIRERLITDEIKKLIPVLGKETAERLNRAYLLGDEEVRKRIFELVDALKSAVFSDKDLKDSVLMEPPDREEASEGDIEIGQVLYGKKEMYPLFYKKNFLLTHIGIFGSSGYGKTNISYWLIEKLSENGIPVLIFDFSKRNYKDLINTPLRDKIRIYTIGRKPSPFKFNPLRPPKGIQLSQWMKEFASIFDHAYWLLGGGRHIILKALESVYEKNPNPRLADLKRWIDAYEENSMPSRERNWLATAERPLASLCFKEIGEVFDCDFGIEPSGFFEKGGITILELDALDTNDKTFFIEIMFQWLRDWLLVKGETEKLQGVIVLEEAHHVLNREKSRKLGTETVVDMIFREIRELGLGIVYIDQHPSLVSYPALGNTSTHIYMNLGLDTKQSSDILDASNMLGLNYQEQGNYLRKLSVGHGFFLCRIAEFHDPFLVKFYKYPIKKGSVNDGDIEKFMEAGKLRIYKEDIIKPEKFKEPEGSKTWAREAEKEAEEETEVDETKEEETSHFSGELLSRDWEIIKILGNGDASFTSQIYRILNVSGTVFNRKVRKLMELGLIASKKAKNGKHIFNYFFLTKVGQGLFDDRFENPAKGGRINLDEVAGLLITSGWKYDNSRFVFKDEKEIVILDNPERKYTANCINSGERYFICANDQIKNMLLQEAARFCHDSESNGNFFVATAKRFAKAGKFEVVEFI